MKRLLMNAVLGGAALSLTRRALRPPFAFAGKAALISGGSRGLGLALAEELLSRGMSVTLLARGEEGLRAAAAHLGEPERVHTVTGDVTDDGDLRRAVGESVRRWGRLDLVVSNAGTIQVGPLADMTEQDLEHIWQTNTLASWRLARHAREHLRGGGRMLLVCSVGGKVAVPHLGPYSVSKFALAGLGQALRAELGRDRIGVTTVFPALMRTGSAKQIEVKGQHEREYALFATAGNVPGLSMNAAAAARAMVNALARGDAERAIGLPGWALAVASNLAPQLLADAMRLTNTLMPGPTGDPRSVPGENAETPLTRGNAMKRQAEERWNQG